MSTAPSTVIHLLNSLIRRWSCIGSQTTPIKANTYAWCGKNLLWSASEVAWLLLLSHLWGSFDQSRESWCGFALSELVFLIFWHIASPNLQKDDGGCWESSTHFVCRLWQFCAKKTLAKLGQLEHDRVVVSPFWGNKKNKMEQVWTQHVGRRVLLGFCSSEYSSVTLVYLPWYHAFVDLSHIKLGLYCLDTERFIGCMIQGKKLYHREEVKILSD